MKTTKNALVLTGGGARGAYQAGVLLGLSEIFSNERRSAPFSIVTGISAGSINAAYVAANLHRFRAASRMLCDMWADLHQSNIFDVRLASLSKNLASNVCSSIFGRSEFWGLLDTKPLEKILTKNLNLESIEDNIEKNLLKAVAVTATQIESSKNITFVQSGDPTIEWESVNRQGKMTKLQLAHIKASASLPILFAPMKIKDRYYTDGALRNIAPLSPAFHLGAERIIIVGVHSRGALQKQFVGPTGHPPTMGRIFSLILNGILLDALESDFARMQRINETLSLMTSENREKSPLRIVKGLLITPSKDISKIAVKHFSSMPSTLKWGINLLGNPNQAAEILSYLLFESKFCQELIHLGKSDALRHSEAVKQLME